MIRKYPLAAAAALCLAASSFAQTPADNLKEDISRAAGNHHCYEYTDLSETPAPKGYKAFYISHYGRHGSRSDTHITNCENLYRSLSEASGKGLLNADGEELLRQVGLMREAMTGMDGHLTFAGGREHQEIAGRMAERYPSVFKKGGLVCAESSTVQRCIVSMGNFTTALGEKHPKLHFTLMTGEPYMEVISATRSIRDEDRKKNLEMINAISSTAITSANDTTAILGIFKDATEGRAFLSGKVEAFQKSITSVAGFAQDFDMEDKVDIFRFIPFNFLLKTCLSNSASTFSKYCNCVEFRQPMKVTDYPLAKDFIDKANKAIEEGECVADLRFGHEFSLVDLASTLQVSDIGDILTLEEAVLKFETWRDLCMGSNLQFIFFRNRKGDVLVKALYNEKERRINGLEPVSGPYYRWSDVKKLYTSGPNHSE